MLLAVPLAVGLVAAVAWRHADGPGGKRGILLVAAVALGVRLAAVLVVSIIAHQTHGTGVWLSDEASFFLATESLLPIPFDRALPGGLEHLGGDGYLGVTTWLAIFGGGVADANTFRVINASFGACVAIVTALIARRLFGARAGVVAGLAAALWPDLVLWSATFLRDTLGSLAVVVVWWGLVTMPQQRRPLVLCLLAFVLVLLATLREYLAVAVGIGILAWFAYPLVRRQRPRTFAIAIVGVLVVGSAVSLVQLKGIDEAAHALIYRQTVTRMETLGQLYRDPPPLGQPMQLPYRPGEAIAIPDPTSGWLSTGLVVDSSQPGVITVNLTDATERTVPISDLELLQDARIPPLQLFSWLVPSLTAVLFGLPDTGEAPSFGWVGSALMWDVLVVLAVLGLVRSGLHLRDWLFPLCVTLGTIAALSAIPGAPGNAERHRAAQTLPALMVLATGLLAPRARSLLAQRPAVLVSDPA